MLQIQMIPYRKHGLVVQLDTTQTVDPTSPISFNHTGFAVPVVSFHGRGEPIVTSPDTEQL